MDFSKVKLVIWDLDETFWQGILSEHTVSVIPANLQLLRDMTDSGVVNSICSKNDASQVEAFLKEWDIWDLFVFPSINWSPKGDRVRQIISEMNLRSANVLFLDDSRINLEETYEKVLAKILKH